MMLPDGWKQGRLGALCSIEIGGTPPRGVAAYWDSALDTSNVWVSIRDMRQRLITGSAEQISRLGVKKSNVKLQQPGTVLLSFKLSIGRVAIAAVPLFTNEAIAGLSPTGLTRDYLFHGLQGWDLLQGVDQAIKGATLNKQKLKKILFEYPESEREQAKIAEVLSTVDRAIEQTEALIGKQQRIKTGLMQDLLTRGIDEHCNLRSEQTHKFKDSPLGRIPAEWDVERLDDIVDESITYGIVQAGPHVDGGVPYIRTGDMRGDEINVEKLLRTAPQVAKSYKRSAVWVGDIVFALRATVGKVLPVTVELYGANLTQGTAKISPKKSIDSDFLLWAMRTSKVQNAIRLEQKGTTFQEITLGDLRTIRIALPKKTDEQSLIGGKLKQHDRVRRDYENQRDKLVSLKRGLMQDLLTGTRRVTALLERHEGVTA